LTERKKKETGRKGIRSNMMRMKRKKKEGQDKEGTERAGKGRRRKEIPG
jgi:hypothetical protein